MTHQQIAGLDANQATKIRDGLLWLESTPAWHYDTAANAFDEWSANCVEADECFSAIESTDDGFLWQDEDGNELEHVCVK